MLNIKRIDRVPNATIYSLTETAPLIACLKMSLSENLLKTLSLFKAAVFKYYIELDRKDHVCSIR